jgi:hypothetical protein
MYRRNRIAAITCLLAVATTVVHAAEPVSKTAKLERLPSSPLLLKAPAGVTGDFDVAKTPPAIDFAVFPNQWEGARLWSSWGDSLFASDGKFYASIGDHAAPHGTAYVYAIDPKANTVQLVVDYNNAAGLPEDKTKYTPGKIHGALVQAKDGGIYFFGYRGSVRKTGKETGYKGDWLLRYDPKSGKTTNLGIAVPFHSVPVLEYVAKTNSLYGLTVPGKTAPDEAFHFARYDLGKKKLVLNQPLKGRGLRAMIVADDGRAWFTNGNGGLDRYDPASNKVQQTKVKVPGDGVLRAASRPDKNGVAYCLSKDGAVFSFDTRTEKVKEIAKAFVAGRLYIAACRLDPTGRYLYYIPGAHGRSSQTGTPVIQLDVNTGRRKVIAFLNEHVRKTKGYNLGGTYGIALNADGSQLCINFNGSKLPLKRQPDFGLCATVILHIPQSERAAKR